MIIYILYYIYGLLYYIIYIIIIYIYICYKVPIYSTMDYYIYTHMLQSSYLQYYGLYIYICYKVPIYSTMDIFQWTYHGYRTLVIKHDNDTMENHRGFSCRNGPGSTGFLSCFHARPEVMELHLRSGGDVRFGLDRFGWVSCVLVLFID